MQLDALIHKADVLVEALPYIADFRGEIVVVKLGGSVMESPEALAGILTDVAFMQTVGMRTIVVHGGGKAISRALKEAGIGTTFVQGLRVTDAASIRVVEDVIKNEVNAEIVRLLEGMQVRAVPLHGENIYFVRRMAGTDPATGAALDWGFVGHPVSVDTGPVRELLREGVAPIVCPLGRGEDGALYNVNADTAAAALAKALPARKLVYVSDVPGLLRDPADPATLIETLHRDDVPALVEDGTISGGMIPKIESCLEALRAGVRKVHLVDGRLSHSLLLEMFTTKGVGTQIVK